MVQEGERGRCAAGDAEARGPRERATGRGGVAVQPGVEAASLEELVDEEAVAPGGAVAEQAREVAVAEAAEHLQLGAELAVSGAGGVVRGEALHGHLGAAVREHGAVHEPEAAVAYDVVRGEFAGGPGKVVQRELLERGVYSRSVQRPRRGELRQYPGRGGDWEGRR